MINTAIVITLNLSCFLTVWFNMRGKYSNMKVSGHKKAPRKYGRLLIVIYQRKLFYRNRDAYFIPIHTETSFAENVG